MAVKTALTEVSIIVAEWGEDLAIATRDADGNVTPQAYLYGHEDGRSQHSEIIRLVRALGGTEVEDVIEIEVDEAGIVEAYPDGNDTFEALAEALCGPQTEWPAWITVK